MRLLFSRLYLSAMVSAALSTISFAQIRPAELAWRGGRLIFDEWVRVDDAAGTAGHPADHPQMVLDSRKHPYLYSVWQDDRGTSGSYEIYFALSKDLGKTWSRPTRNLSQTTGTNDIYPWIAVDSRDTLRVKVYVVWQSWVNNTWKVLISRSLDGGASFSTPVDVPGVTVTNSFSSGINFGPQPKIAVDYQSSADSTFLYLIWSDQGSGNLRIQLATSAAPASSDSILGAQFTDLGPKDNNLSNANRHPYVAVTPTGKVMWAWARGTGGSSQDPHPWIGFNYSTTRGRTGQSEDVIVNDDRTQAYRGHPTITFNANNGNILVAWEDSRSLSDGSPNIVWARSTDGGATFSTNQRANRFPDTTAVYENRKPAIWMDPHGTAVIAWHDNNNPNSRFGIHLAAYNDTVGQFGLAQSLFKTFTQTTAGNFGGNLYPPSLKVVTVDSADNFFLVWQDFVEDTTGGNIYSIRGRVIFTWADLDIFDDSLDMVKNVLDFGTQPAGPPDHFKSFLLIHADSIKNPDPDGYSIDTLMRNLDASSVTLYGPNGYHFDTRVILPNPSVLKLGQAAVCTVVVMLPDTALPGSYEGVLRIRGIGSMHGDTVFDNFTVRITCAPAPDLSKVKVFPNPCKVFKGMRKIYFYNIPANATVRIYDAAGDRVKQFREEIQNGLAIWDAPTAGGLYFYVVQDAKGKIKKGKLSIIR